MSDDNLIVLKIHNLPRDPLHDAVFGVHLNRAIFAKDADQAALLFAHWLQTHKLTVNGHVRRTLMSVLCPGPRKEG